MSKIIYLFLIFSLFNSDLFSQENIEVDKEEHYKTLALNILITEGLNTDRTIVSRENLIKFLKGVDITITEIENHNFEGYNFIHIAIKKGLRDLSLPVIWWNSDCNGYIIAVSKGDNFVYKLKGFVRNEFYSFYRQLKLYERPYTKSKRAFIKHYRVAGLDFKCLFNSLSLKHSRKDLKNYPCVSDTCSEVFRTHDF